MKYTFYKVITILIISLLTLSGCSKLSDECKETRWDKIEDPIIYLRATAGTTSFVYDYKSYNLSEASSITFTGTITKYYCSDDVSGSFEFNTTLYPVNGTISLTRVKIGGPYQFNFQNDKDRLRVELRLRVAFPDGLVFRPPDSNIDNFYFNSIQFNANDIEHFILFTTSPNETFNKVSG